MKYQILFLLCLTGCAHQKDVLFLESSGSHSAAVKDKPSFLFPVKHTTQAISPNDLEHRTTGELSTNKNKSKTKDCQEKGVDMLFKKAFSLGLKGRKLSKTALKVLRYFEKHPRSYCPSFCQQKDTFKSFIKIAPINWIKNSCPPPESKEVYAFKKTWKALPETEARKQRVREYLEYQMSEWILNTFVHPYVPGARYQPTKEVSAYRIKEACPSCSFYFNYNYFYESDSQLKLDIQVTCGDRKKGFGLSRKAELKIQNHWQCLKP